MDDDDEVSPETGQMRRVGSKVRLYDKDSHPHIPLASC
jgi:hypothetical protein